MRGTCATVSPVAGSTTGNVSPESDSSSSSGRSATARHAPHDTTVETASPASASAISAQVRDRGDVRHRVVERGVLPLVVDRRRAVGGDDRAVARIGRVACGVLDRHVRPGARDDQRLDAEAAQQDVEARLVERRSCASSRRRGRRPAARARRRAQRPSVPRTSAFAPFTPSNSGAFCFSPGAPSSTMYQTWITGTPALRHAAASARTFATTFWLGRVRGRAGVGERAALDDHVVLQVLDDQGRALRVDRCPPSSS